MKKLFTLVAMAFMAVGASAQTISWTADDVVSSGGLNGKTYGEGFVVTCVDEKEKMVIDANTAYFGTAESYEKLSYRLKSGGKSESTEGKRNEFTLTIPSDGTLSVYARTGSSSATDRTVVLTQDETELYNQVVQDADAITVTIEEKDTKVYPAISVTVKAGTVSVTYPVGSINFYGFKLESSSSAINSISADTLDENAPIYNLAGQRVSKDAKGVKIQNGKKFF